MRMLSFIAVVVTSCVLVAIISFLTLNWLQKRKQHRQLEQLLDDIQERQNSRKNRLSRKLTRQFDMPEDEAQGISEQLIGAEKLFLQHYIGQLLTQKPSDIVYDHLCELLDDYLNRLPHQNKDSAKAAKTQQSASDPEIASVAPETDPAENSNAIPEPDWGDVFD